MNYIKNEIIPKTISVLLIDDSEVEAKLVKFELEESETEVLKFKLERAESLSSGLKMLAEKTYDVVLLDMGLPDSIGFEGLEKVIENDPKVAVIIFTGNEEKSIGMDAISIGAQDFIVKKHEYQNRELSNKIFYSHKRKEENNNLTFITNRLKKAQRLAKLGFFELELVSNSMRWSEQIYEILNFNKDVTANYNNFIKNISENGKEKLESKLNSIEKTYGKIENKRSIAFNIDFELHLKNEQKHIQLSADIIIDNVKGIKKITGNIQDITEFKNQKIHLIETKKSTNNLIKIINVAYYEADFDGNIIDVNNGFLDLFKYTKEEFELLDKNKLFENDAEKQKFVHAIQSNKEYDKFKITFIKKDGELLTGLLNLSFKNGLNNKPSVYYGTITDFSQLDLLKAKEVAENTAKIREQFLAQMSHEIRTPMNGVVGMTELLADTILNKTQLELVDALKISSKNLLNIINQILDFSKIESGNLVIEKTPFKLIELINETCRIFKYSADKKGLKFLTTLDGNVPEIVVGDLVRLNQILNNLLSNALKYTETGMIKVTVLEENTNEKNTTLKFYIEDTGIGISEENIEKIFKPFSQEKKETTRLYGGTGLGLSIARQLVNLMDGDIKLESVVGKGSTFIFTAVFDTYFDTTDQKTASIVEHNPLMKSKKAFKSNVDVDAIFDINKELKILYVEDDKMNQIVAKKLIKSIYPNMEIDIADNGQIGVDKVKDNHYDLVLMDVGLPILSGIEATKVIRNLDFERKNIPIIACTAHAFSTAVDNCINAGMNDFISKPLIKRDIKNKLNKAFNNIFSSTENTKKDIQYNDNELEDIKAGNLVNSQIIEPIINNGEEEKDKKYKVIDLTYLIQISDGTNEMLTLYIDTLINDVPIDMAKLENAISEKKWINTKSFAHKLKSSLTYMGISKAVGNMRFIENSAAKNENLNELMDVYYTSKQLVITGLEELNKYKLNL